MTDPRKFDAERPDETPETFRTSTNAWRGPSVADRPPVPATPGRRSPLSSFTPQNLERLPPPTRSLLAGFGMRSVGSPRSRCPSR